MKNMFKELDTETLKWMNYKWASCRGFCEECPCHDTSYYCSYIHDEVKKELSRRKE